MIDKLANINKNISNPKHIFDITIVYKEYKLIFGSLLDKSPEQ